jgi:hypothetical protein
MSPVCTTYLMMKLKSLPRRKKRQLLSQYFAALDFARLIQNDRFRL